MLKFGKKTSEPQNEEMSGPEEGRTSWLKNNQRSIMAVTLIALMAFVLRFVFAYGTSADSGYALSGGTSASEHLRTVTAIVSGTYNFGLTDVSSYPFDTANTNPILVDLVVALFAMIGKACGMTAVAASAAALSWFSVIFGTLCVVAMFFLGKEVIGTKKAGYLAALFLAFCPVVISQTVFSNGTEVAVYGFLAIIFFLFVYKGLKAFDVSTVNSKFVDMFKANKVAMKNAILAGVMLTLIAYSWNGFRSLVAIMIIPMIIMMVIYRLKSKDARVPVVFFSIIIAICEIVALPYYIAAGLWDLVFSGTFYLAVIWIAVGFAFALLQKKPWIVTIPAFTIGLIVAFILVAVFAPNLFSLIFSGNTYTASAFSGLGTSTLSISEMGVNFGYVTMWFGIAAFAVMLFRLPKNLSSPTYVFTMLFILMGTYYSTKSDLLATVFAPVFALGFAYVLMWLFNNVDFKSYFVAIKNSDLKSLWKKILKPIPFLSVLAVVVLICVPNAMYAIDAGISSNDADKYSGIETGGVSYYVKTDSDWKINDVLSDYSNIKKDGALVTWSDYSSDAIAYGGFSTVADSNGNGADAVVNILLADGTNGASTAAMLIYLLKYTGFNDSVKSAIVKTDLLSEDSYNMLKDIVTNPAKYKSAVINDETKYGAVATTISDANVAYIYGKVYLTDNYSAYQITKMYEAIEDLSGKSISYVMVTGNMFPIYYGYSSTFATMGYVNGYALTDSYGTVGQFETVDYFTQYYTGYYNYTDAMYDTLLWRTYIGMSPADAGFTGMLAPYNLLSNLMLSDGTYKAQPGYGLSNYTVDYSSWYVMYNADSSVTTTTGDGWTKMLYTEAIALQESKGGLINYLSGLPVFLKYVSTDSGNAVSGTITDEAGNKLSGIRVSVINSEGAVCSTATTDSNGSYTVFVVDESSKIKYFAGSSSLNDGILVKTVDYSKDLKTQDVKVSNATFSGYLVDSDGKQLSGDGMSYQVTITGTVSKKSYTTECAGTNSFSFTGVVPDVYTITAKSLDGKLSYLDDDEDAVTCTIYMGDNKGYKLEVNTYKVTVTVTDKDTSSNVPKGVEVTLESAESDALFTGKTDSEGKAEIYVIAGTYYASVDGYAVISSSFSVSSSSSQTVNVISGTTYKVTGMPAGRLMSVYSSGFTTAVSVGQNGNAYVTIPSGTDGGSKYTAYAYYGGKVYLASLIPGATEAAADAFDAVKVSGTAKNGDDAVETDIVFTDSNGRQVSVSTDSDGKYSVYLWEDTYTLYAYGGSLYVYLQDNYELSGTDDRTLDFALVDGKEITISSYWNVSSNYMRYQQIEVTDIKSGSEVKYSATFYLQTDSSGEVTFCIPSDMTCSVKAILPDGKSLYYGDSDNKEYTKTETDVSSSTSFKATFGSLQVKNETGYTVEFGGETIENGSTGTIDSPTRVQSVSIDYVDGAVAGAKYYYSGSVYVKPTNDVLKLTSEMITPTAYFVAEFVCENESDDVTITAIDDGSYNTKSASSSDKTKSYYLEYDKAFKVTVANEDDSKIWYYTVSNVSADVSKAVELKEFATIEGYVGLSQTGTLTVTAVNDGWSFDVSISSGSYSGLELPIDKAYKLSAYVYEGDEGEETAKYNAERTIADNALSAGKTYTYNLAVVSDLAFGEAKEVTADAEITAVSGDTARRTVTVKVDATTTNDVSTTYTLAGGSQWFDIQFYSDAELTTQITTATLVNGSYTTFYAKGTVVYSKAAIGSDDLSVTFTAKDEECGSVSVLDPNGKYAKTETKTSVINYGTDIAGNGEYEYAIQIINKDNYTKWFKVSQTAGIDSEDWIVTIVKGEKIYENGSSIDVAGYTTETVYVKITSKLTEGSATAPTSNVTTKVEVETSGEILTSDDLSKGISIDGTTATVESETFKTMLEVTKSGASGRGVFNDQGSMPVYIWVLIILIVLMFLVIIWLASKRGVFSRKK